VNGGKRGPLLASLALHLAVLTASLVSWPWSSRPIKMEVTPVTLLTSEQLAELMAATHSDEPRQAAVEEPAPEPIPEPPAPAPAPEPAPAPPPRLQPVPTPALKATPKAAPTPAPKGAAPQKAPPPKAAPMDLDALAKSLAANTKRPAGAPSSAAPKGKTQEESDIMARLSQGQARAASNNALSAIRDKVQRLWNPNCDVEGGSAVRVRVKLNLNPDGSLSRQPDLVDHRDVNAIADPVLKAAASRALSAVARGSPYEGLPRQDYDYWREVILNFDARQACRGV